MAEQIKLSAMSRTEKGKGVAKRLRREGKLPAVVYGHKTAPIALTIDSKQLLNLIVEGKSEHKLFDLSIEGNGKPIEKTVMIKELQIDPLKRNFLHVDFFEVSMDEEITLSLVIKLVGEAPGVEMGGVLQQVRREIEIKCLPSQIPDSVEIDVSALNIGDSIHLNDIQLPAGIKVLDDADLTIATVLAPTVEKEVAPEEAEEEVAEEAAEAAEAAEKGEERKPEEDKKAEEGDKGGKGK
jgi:large subunit ribosomal protein L25